MKRHERCRIGGSSSRGAGEIPLLSSFFYLFDGAGAGLTAHLLALQGRPLVRGRPASKTVSGGEFGWGGTSVKR